MTAFVAGLIFLIADVGRTEGEVADLVFSGGRRPERLRLEIATAKGSPDAAWRAFLNHLFDHFDRNADGFLDPAEAARLFPLPLGERREAVMDFATLDSNQDGKGSRAEFQAFYQRKGFTPILFVIEPPTAQAHALSEALFRLLDRDGDGRLTEAELEQAPALLRSLDVDEDEVLSPAELLTLPPVGKPDRGTVSIESNTDAVPGGALLITIGSNEPFRMKARGDDFRPLPSRPGDKGITLQTPHGICRCLLEADAPAAAFQQAKAFYLAQFKAAMGDQSFVVKKTLEDDPTQQVLARLFDAADRDGDGRLTDAELKAFLDLIEDGLGCRIVVTIRENGRNLFDLLDENQDGRLDLGELNRAGRTLSTMLTTREPFDRLALPYQYSMTIGRTAPGSVFGPAPIGGRTTKSKSAGRAVLKGPAWFRALDKNGDGFLSPREFIGSPDLFRKLDKDGDGRISVEEAE